MVIFFWKENLEGFCVTFVHDFDSLPAFDCFANFMDSVNGEIFKLQPLIPNIIGFAMSQNKSAFVQDVSF